MAFSLFTLSFDLYRFVFEVGLDCKGNLVEGIVWALGTGVELLHDHNTLEGRKEVSIFRLNVS
jgi:hypothetical protein